jgi:hypothetical protein
MIGSGFTEVMSIGTSGEGVTIEGGLSVGGRLSSRGGPGTPPGSAWLDNQGQLSVYRGGNTLYVNMAPTNSYLQFRNASRTWQLEQVGTSFRITDQPTAVRIELVAGGLVRLYGGTQIENNCTITGNCLIADAGVQYSSQSADFLKFGYDANWGGNPGVHLYRDNAWACFIPGTVSDERLKRRVTPATIDALAAISQLKMFRFERRDPAERRFYHSDLGFTAQQVREVIPAAVAASPPARNAQGEELHPDGGPVLGINYNTITEYNTRSIQQLLARIEELEKKVR